MAVRLADVLLLDPVWCQIHHLFAADVFWISLIAFTAADLFQRKAAERPFSLNGVVA
jgi:hypothetical protein